MQDFPLCAVAVQAVPAVVIGMTWTRKSATWSRSIPPPPLLYEKVTEVGPLPLERAIQLSPVGTLTTLASSTSKSAGTVTRRQRMRSVPPVTVNVTSEA